MPIAADDKGIQAGHPKVKLTAEHLEIVSIPPQVSNNRKSKLSAATTKIQEIPPDNVVVHPRLSVQILPSVNIPKKLKVQKVFVYSIKKSIETVAYHPDARNIGFYLDQHNSMSNQLHRRVKSPTPTVLNVHSAINTMDSDRDKTIINLIHVNDIKSVDIEKISERSVSQVADSLSTNLSKQEPEVSARVSSDPTIETLRYRQLYQEPHSEQYSEPFGVEKLATFEHNNLLNEGVKVK